MRVLQRPWRLPSRDAHPTLNGLTLLVLIALAAGIPIAFRMGIDRARREARMRGAPAVARAQPLRNGDTASIASSATDLPPAAVAAPPPDTSLDAERARLIRAAERERWQVAQMRAGDTAAIAQLTEFAEERIALLRALADARTETARYREIVVDLEDNARPLLLDAPNSPDDLMLIVGVGPVLERMLQRMGISSYRQIARWSEHDIDEFDAKLQEFRGRIRRDGWVTQARALHQSKYGERPA